MAANVPEYMVRDGQRYRLITDNLGSVRLVVNTATGEVVQQVEYDAYGRVTRNSSPGFQPFGFGGGLIDDATGLTRFGARDYDAESGRWTAKDPIGFAGGDANVYVYAQDDPVNLSDPSGLTVICVYEQFTGHLVCTDVATGKVVVNTVGYAGHGAGKNNPFMTDVPDTGPLPGGDYEIVAPAYYGARTGPVTLELVPSVNNLMFGRSLFRIHGDNSRDPGNASAGCPVIDPISRNIINNSGGGTLHVVPGTIPWRGSLPY
jgi:RHS repeat-associated protein